jgi:hypothetical protein
MGFFVTSTSCAVMVAVALPARDLLSLEGEALNWEYRSSGAVVAMGFWKTNGAPRESVEADGDPALRSSAWDSSLSSSKESWLRAENEGRLTAGGVLRDGVCADASHVRSLEGAFMGRGSDPSSAAWCVMSISRIAAVISFNFQFRTGL